MPRFVAKPVIVTAFQYDGHLHLMPEAFRLAVRGHRAGGIIEVMTGDGVRQCKHEDWIVHGPDGSFSVQRNAMFETWFTEQTHVEPPTPTPAARADTRRKAHA
jgi:hypothetical protein